MKTLSVKAGDISRKWYVVDAEGKTLGRIATEVARRLRGKHKPIYTPHLDTGDYIVIINSAKVVVTGNKAKQKMYHHHTGYVGHLKSFSFEKMMERKPTETLRLAIKGMLPKNALGRAMMKKCRIYAGASHDHEAQQPEVLVIG